MKTALYTHPLCKLHQISHSHPECPARIDAIENALIAAGLDRVLDYRIPPEATVADLCRVHDPKLVEKVRANIPSNPNEYSSVGGMSFNMYGWDAALRAAGAGIDATNAVIDGKIKNAFCLVRPIGHHANVDTPMGFCLFNNAAIAAKYAMEVRGLERVAIVDIDVHHGNGTEDIFADEPRMMMVSFYQSFLYPMAGGRFQRDHLVNIGLQARADGTKVREVVNEHWLPALHRHKPQLIYFSAGFDAHRNDTLGNLALVEADYAWITQQMMDVADQYANGRVVSFLEGGYNLVSLANSAVAHIGTLAGQI
ncbi:MAG: histone deacetylase family protein [Oxalobacter sp.]|nr:MAG: histone deacetylase family protein [Oxalobacter sp.]